MLKIEIQQNSNINPTQQYLENIDLRTDFININVDFKKLHSQYRNLFDELGEEFELKWDQLIQNKVIFKFNLLNLQPTNYHIFFEPEYHFNRYRLIALRNSFYKDPSSFDLQKWRTYCRSKEKEAFKAGLTNEVWNSPVSEDLLGKADDPGYFGGNGSSGWKLNAIADFCLDLYCQHEKVAFMRLSAYDSYLAQGKIELLGNALKLRKHEKPIQQMISRKIGYHIPKDEDKDEIS